MIAMTTLRRLNLSFSFFPTGFPVKDHRSMIETLSVLGLDHFSIEASHAAGAQ